MKTTLNGVDVYYAHNYGDHDSNYICHNVKEGDLVSTIMAAKDLHEVLNEHNLTGCNIIFVPVPGHKGYATTAMNLCRELMPMRNCHVADVFHAEPRQLSLYDCKKLGIGVTLDDIGAFITAPHRETCKRLRDMGYTFVLVDNVIDTGLTMKSALKALNKALDNNCKVCILTIASTGRFNMYGK